jgi:hypothetical protein
MKRILFDQGVPAPLKQFLEGNLVDTCFERGWSDLTNGDLITKADLEYDVFLTTDKNLRYQQNLSERKVAILVLPTTRWPMLKPYGIQIAEAVTELEFGKYREWDFPESVH